MTAVRDFGKMLEAKWNEGKFLCVGLDSDITRIPPASRKESTRATLVAFNRAIVDATKDVASSYKINPAFYEVFGDEGWAALRETIAYIIETAADAPVILDAKRGDILYTNEKYAESAFLHLRADAITVTPYLGGEPLKPFFDHEGKGVIVLCHTSNPGAGEVQNLSVDGTSIGLSTSEPLYKVIARLAKNEWNGHGNCCVMVGATYPEELKEVRDVVGEMPILIAGIGAQDGDLRKTIQNGLDSRGRGLIVNASRSIIFASHEADFAEAAAAKAKELHEAIGKAAVQ